MRDTANIEISQINPRVTLIIEKMDWLTSVVLGFIGAIGSRYENENNNGITHLTEHMLFKGTANKSAYEIAKITETLGVKVDAFTAKESAGVYCRLLAEKFNQVVDVLCEIMNGAIFNDDDLQKEKQVIIQEIREANDSPRDYLYDLLAQIMFPQHPLSFPIAGRNESVTKLTRADLVNFYRDTLFNCRICISLSGQIDNACALDKIINMSMPYRDLDYWRKPIPPKQKVERTMVMQTRNEIKQIHCLLGVLTIPLSDSRRDSLNLLNSIIGGAISSRLNQRLREKEGLLNFIISYLDLYSDVGLWSLYFITELTNLQKSWQFIFQELTKLKNEGVREEELRWAKNYNKGMLSLVNEDPLARVTHNAHQYLYLKKIRSTEEIIFSLEKITLLEINEIISLINFDDFLGALIGPIQESDLKNLEHIPAKIINLSNKNEYNNDNMYDIR